MPLMQMAKSLVMKPASMVSMQTCEHSNSGSSKPSGLFVRKCSTADDAGTVQIWRTTDLFQGRAEAGQLLVAVELGAVFQAARPGEDGV